MPVIGGSRMVPAPKDVSAAVNSVSNTDGLLAVSPTTGAVVVNNSGLLPALTFATHATGDTVSRNTYNHITSGGHGIINLPANGQVGAQVVIDNRQTFVSNTLVVTPQGGGTIEGSAGLNLPAAAGNTGARCWLVDDGTNWAILAVDPNAFAFLLGPGGYVNAATPFKGITLYAPRSGLSSFNFGGVVKLAATTSNIDWSIGCPRWSAGTVFLSSLTFGVIGLGTSPFTPADALVLNAPASALGSSNPLTSGTSLSGNSFGSLTTWTTASSIGSDLSIDGTGGSLDSAAGGYYWWYITGGLTTSLLVP